MSGWLRDCLLHTAEDLGWWDGILEEEKDGARCGLPGHVDGCMCDLCFALRTPPGGRKYICARCGAKVVDVGYGIAVREDGIVCDTCVEKEEAQYDDCQSR
jgi:DNA-directed RNA polymerase subunit RPC12/RpoP